MNVSPCPNCGGANLYASKPASARGPYGPNLLPGLSGIFKSATFHLIICQDCGLTRFFAGPEALEKLPDSNKWARIAEAQ